jgi:FkbM family methyltransferase
MRLLKSVRLPRRGSTAKRAARQLLRGFSRFGIDLVLDVGANVGQYARQIRAGGFAGRIVSFEPLSDAHARLTAAAAGRAGWSVHPRCAVGDSDGTAQINISANSVSSSMLPMTAAHSAAAPDSTYVGREATPVVRLDAIAGPYLVTARQPFLKIDTQGYEWQVLAGATDTLARLRGVQCEISFVELYDGQHLWREMIDRLERAGFTLWTLQTGFGDPRDGRTLQCDAIFFRVGSEAADGV